MILAATNQSGLWGYPWFKWGAFLIVFSPLLLVLLTELVHRLRRKDSAFTGLVQSLRNLVLPLLCILILLKQVLGFPPDRTIVRVIETLFWIFVINSSLQLVNAVLFCDREDDSWQSRVPKLILDITRLVLVLIGAAFVLSYIWGANLGDLLTALGVGSVVIGLALQDTLGGLFAGIALISGRTFAVGDWLKVGDVEGVVHGMTWRTVMLKTRAGNLVTVPNAVIAKENLTNFSQPTTLHRVTAGFDLHFRDAPNHVQEVFARAARETEGVLADPPPVVFTTSYDIFSVHHDVHFWIDDYAREPAIKNALVTRCYYIAKREGLTWPAPQREVYHFDKADMDSGDTPETRAVHLSNSELMRLTDGEMQHLCSFSETQHYGAGEIVLPVGVQSPHLYFITSGSVDVQVPAGGDVTEFHSMATLGKGDFFGEISLLRAKKSEVQVFAKSDLEVVAIPEAAAKKILEKSPAFTRALNELIEDRLGELGRFRNSLSRGPASVGNGEAPDLLGEILKIERESAVETAQERSS